MHVILNRLVEKPTQDEKMRFSKRNELSLSQLQLFSFFFLKKKNNISTLHRISKRPSKQYHRIFNHCAHMYETNM